MTEDTEHTIFDDFTKWHPIFDNCQVSLADIKADKFNPEKHRKAAAQYLDNCAEEVGDDDIDATISVLLKSGNEETVKGFVEEGKTSYGERIKALLTERFDEFYEATPEGARKQLYSDLQLVAPGDGPENLGSEFSKAVKLHKTISEIYEKLSRLQNKDTPTVDRNKIQDDFTDDLIEHYKSKYLADGAKAAENKGLVEKLEIFAKANPEIATSRFAKLYEDSKEEFEKIVELANLKEYLSAALDTDSLRKLYGLSAAKYEHDKEVERQKKNSDFAIANK